MKKNVHYDVLIIGSGAAGLGLALSLAHSARIALVSKSSLTAGSSQKAQGGIAAVMNQNDSPESHIQDTLIAGAGLCKENVVEFVVKNAKEAIEWLVEQGVQFTVDNKTAEFHLTQEGGHSQRRVLHVADKTGAAVVETLSEQVKNHPNIDCFINHTAVDLITQDQKCLGAFILENETGNLFVFNAKITVLATGGVSGIYLHTSNTEETSGDGMAMAWRAGCQIANLEFNQFHPTCLYHPQSQPFLITEAVRGEGGKLVLPNGEAFMQQYDARAELAPRDIVARAIDSELKKHQIPCVYLDIRHKSSAFIKQYFPTIYSYCLGIGIDITQELIPVVPAAHYTCGGVVTDLNGQTNIAHLYAIGEVACTGMHGANRMASNSLLECLVFAMSAAKSIAKILPNIQTAKLLPQAKFQGIDPNKINIEKSIQSLREMIWTEVGIVRLNERLKKAAEQIHSLKTAIESSYSSQFPLTKSVIELRNHVLLCELIVCSAKMRKESRGLHYNLDYPNLAEKAIDTVICQNSESINEHVNVEAR
jgi:L-aspartate oxidase